MNLTQEKIRKIIAFSLFLIVVWDLTLGMPYGYQKTGLCGQTIIGGNRVNDDVILGKFIEKTFYNYNSEGVSLSECNTQVTEEIYYLMAAVIPSLTIILILMLYDPRYALILFKKTV